MEEKERFELNDNDCIIDNEKDVAICDICDVSESPKILVDLLNQQDKRIKELEEENKMANINNYLADYWLAETENQQLKQQLAEKDKEIVRLNKFLQAMKIREHNQDKISFTIEQLEKVKENILSYENVYYQFLESGAKVPVVCLENFRVKQTIDNQIKELKGEE